ncbi:hypothetical protein B566_EDAN016785, partial [Ephemera danica]
MNNDSDSDYVVIESSKGREKESSPVGAQDESEKPADTSQFVPILPMPPDATEEMRLSKLKRLIPRTHNNPRKKTVRQSLLRSEPLLSHPLRSQPLLSHPLISQSPPMRYKVMSLLHLTVSHKQKPDVSKHITIEELRVFLTTKENFKEKLEQYFYHTFGEIDYITPFEPAFIFKLSYTPQLNIEVDSSERIKCIPCLFCTSTFPTLKEHFTHLITVHRMCKVCHAPSANYKALLHHLACHEEGEYMLYSCMDCVRIFSCYGEFTKHKNECKQHRGQWRHSKKISTKMSELQCPYCCLNFVKLDAMIKHVLSIHKVRGFKCEGVEEIEDSSEVQEEDKGPTKSGDDEAVVSIRPYLVPSRRMWDNLQDIKDLCMKVPSRRMWDNLQDIKDLCMKGEHVEDHLIDYCYTLPSLQFYLNHENITMFIHQTSFRPNYTIQSEVSSRIKCVPCLRCDVRCDSLQSHFEHQIKTHFECKTCQVSHKRPMDLIDHFEVHEAELQLIKHIVTSHRVPNFAFTFNDDVEKDKFVKDLLQAKPWHRTGPRIVRKSVKKVKKPTRKIPSPSPRSLRAKRKRIPSKTDEEIVADDGAKVGDLECPRCCLNFMHELDLLAHVSRWHKDFNIKFELKKGEAEVLAKKVAVFKSKGMKRQHRKRKVSTSSDSSSEPSESDGPADNDDSR